MYIFSPWNEFIDHLSTIRLDDDRMHQHPPKLIILETARILFKSVNQITSLIQTLFFLYRLMTFMNKMLNELHHHMNNTQYNISKSLKRIKLIRKNTKFDIK
jgi:hypothetical protein